MTLQRQLDKVGGRQSWLILPPFSRCKPTPNWLEQFHSDLKHAERHGTYNPLHHCPFHFDRDAVLDYCDCSTRLAYCQSVRLRPCVDQSSLHHITDLVGPLDCPSSGYSIETIPNTSLPPIFVLSLILTSIFILATFGSLFSQSKFYSWDLMVVSLAFTYLSSLVAVFWLGTTQKAAGLKIISGSSVTVTHWTKTSIHCFIFLSVMLFSGLLSHI